MLMLMGPLPPWARFVAAGIIAAAVVWALAGQTLIRNRHKLDGLWYSKALTIIGCVVALTGFFSRIFGSTLKPFYGYDMFTADRPTMVGYVTVGAAVAVLVLALVVRASRTGLLLSALEALLGAFGGVIWVHFILDNSQTLAYGTYLMEVGFACVVVASLWQFKELADRMPDPGETVSADR
jgi:uncharacterized membrane protein YeaQ/YmgE (transglycosylase-associated protein family)